MRRGGQPLGKLHPREAGLGRVQLSPPGLVRERVQPTRDDPRSSRGGKPAPRSSGAIVKTNAARLLETLRIRYELREYDPGDGHLPAEEVARRVGLAPEQVFKTLVCRGDRTGVLLGVIPGDTTLDLKGVAKLSGDRTCDTVALKDVQPLTGYVRGGVTAIACRKEYPTYVDATIELFEVISVSAGVRGTQILVAPADYLRATKGRIGPIARPKAGSEPPPFVR
jgi:Cys-tRNA(Pro)/Cys-tRNA(Cys) deacylase